MLWLENVKNHFFSHLNGKLLESKPLIVMVTNAAYAARLNVWMFTIYYSAFSMETSNLTSTTCWQFVLNATFAYTSRLGTLMSCCTWCKIDQNSTIMLSPIWKNDILEKKMRFLGFFSHFLPPGLILCIDSE